MSGFARESLLLEKKVDHLRDGLSYHLGKEQILALRDARVGIAGAGGLGSNVAMMLARSGIENFILIDDDTVEPSNLNRQHYWPGQVGQKKVEALARHMHELNCHIQLNLKHMRLDKDNMKSVLAECPIWVEALDRAETKSTFVQAALDLNRFTVAASGLGGYGGEPMRVKRMGSLVVAGDFKTAACGVTPPLAPRVIQAAALMADAVLEHILAPLND